MSTAPGEKNSAGDSPCDEREEMTDRELAAYGYIWAYSNQHEMSPSMSEVAKGLGSEHAQTAAYIVENLEEKGYIKKRPHTPRSLRIV